MTKIQEESVSQYLMNSQPKMPLQNIEKNKWIQLECHSGVQNRIQKGVRYVKMAEVVQGMV